MIYEVRMTVSFIYKEGRRVQSKYDRFEVTLIDYIEADGIGEAFNKAAEYKHEVAIEIAKGETKLWEKKAWGDRSDEISISLGAVVAKPEIKELPSSLKILKQCVEDRLKREKHGKT